MILVDANVLMYANGAEHPNKPVAIRFLKHVAEGQVEAIVDAELLQEIIHRYRAIRRWPEGQEVYELTRTVFPRILPITGEVMDHAKRLIDSHPNLCARDAVHAAVVIFNNLEGICTFDRDFDRIQGCKRIDPEAPAPTVAT